MAWTEVKVATLSQMLFQLGQNHTNKIWKQSLLWPGTAAQTIPKRAPFHFCWGEWWFASNLSPLPGHTQTFNGFVLRLYLRTSGNPHFAPDLKQHQLQSQSTLRASPAWTYLQLWAASQGKGKPYSDNASHTPSTSGFCSRCTTGC